MAVLSTVPSFDASRPGPSVQKAKSSKFLQLVRAATSASADALATARQGAENHCHSQLLSTDEVKVSAGCGRKELISVSVPRFCVRPVAKEQSPPVPCRPQGVLTKPPGLHIRPPPGLTSQPRSEAQGSSNQDLRALLGLPPLQSSLVPAVGSSVTASSSEEDEDSTSEYDDANAPAALPLPVLLGSRPQPSLPGSMPCFAKPLRRNHNDHGKILAGMQRHVIEMPVELSPS